MSILKIKDLAKRRARQQKNVRLAATGRLAQDITQGSDTLPTPFAPARLRNLLRRVRRSGSFGGFKTIRHLRRNSANTGLATTTSKNR